MIADGRDSTPRVLISHSKSHTYPGNINFTLDGSSTPSPWRSGLWSGGNGANPGAPVKKVILVDPPINGQSLHYSSTPSTWKEVRTGEAGNSGAPVKQPVSVEYRLSNGHGDKSSPASKAAPIRHLSFSRCSFKQVSVDIRKLRELAVRISALKKSSEVPCQHCPGLTFSSMLFDRSESQRWCLPNG